MLRRSSRSKFLSTLLILGLELFGLVAISAVFNAAAAAGIPPIPPTASRPSYNTGNGFFVVGRGIYDANGNLFIPIGANRQHYDASEDSRFNAKPNAERMVPFFNLDWTTVNKPFMDDDVNNNVVPIPGVFYTNYTTGTQTTGSKNLADLNTAVGFWTSQAANWTQYNNVAMFNIANEWGPCSGDSNAADYQNGYVSAVQAMRTAGYTGPLVVDAGCSGEGFDEIIASAETIEAADPLHSVVFSIHSYGEFYVTTPICNGCGWQWAPAIEQLASLSVPVIFGEFGCGPPCGDINPTPVTPDILMQTLQTYQMGWLAWSWDDGGCEFNLLGPCPNSTGTWNYSNMSAYGKDVILSPTFGMQAASKTATVFNPKTSTHDFNGDGKSDILWRDNSGDVAMWLMNGVQLLSQSGGVATVPSGWTIVGQRDFNSDGKADILWQDNSGNVAIWFMNGAQMTQSAGVANASSAWTIHGTGDFNGDGHGDILWQDNSGNVAIWLMNGAQITQSVGVSNASSAWTIIGTGDFNGDGTTDILWRDTSGDVAIWLINGAQLTQTVGLTNVSSAWTIIGTGDFNGDGTSDILWRDTSGDVAIWLINGAQLTQTVGVANVSSAWTVQGIGDFNGDGTSDILWRDNSGNVAIWFMNNAQLTQSAGVANVSSTWTIQSAGAMWGPR
jgi:sRNA-binding regulator protein Hfq